MIRKLLVAILSLSMLLTLGACSGSDQEAASPIQDKWLTLTLEQLELSQVAPDTFAVPPQGGTNSVAAIAPALELFGRFGAQHLLPALDSTIAWLLAQQPESGGLFEDPAAAATPREATFLSLRALRAVGPVQLRDSLDDVIGADIEEVLAQDTTPREQIVDLRWSMGALAFVDGKPSPEVADRIAAVAEAFAATVNPDTGDGFVDLTTASAVLVALDLPNHDVVRRLDDALRTREQALSVEDLSNVPELLANVEARSLLGGPSYLPAAVESRAKAALASCYEAEQLFAQPVGIFHIVVLAYAAGAPPGQEFPALACVAALQLRDGTFGTTSYRAASAFATEMAMQTFEFAGVAPRELDELWSPARSKCDLVATAGARELLSVTELKRTHAVYDCGAAIDQRLEALLATQQSYASVAFLIVAADTSGADTVVERGLAILEQFGAAHKCQELDLPGLAVIASVSSRIGEVSNTEPACVPEFIEAFENESDYERWSELEIYAYLQLHGNATDDAVRRMSAAIDQFIISSPSVVDSAQVCRVAFVIRVLRGDRLEGWCDV